MNILIIGGAGFVGTNLARRCLSDSPNRVTVLDSLEPQLRSTTEGLAEVWPRLEFIKGDMSDEVLMAKVVAGQDVIFNCAAQTSHPLSLQHPLLDAEINCLGNLKLLETLKNCNRQAVIVYTSSSTVIGHAPGATVDEDHPERPLDIYSANKGVAEKYYRIYNVMHELKTVVLRFANLYGPFGKGYPEFGFINYFIHQASEDQEITVYGSGKQLRNVMFVEDAADILYESAGNASLHGKVLFATHDEHLSVMQVAQKIVAVFGSGRVVNVDWPEMRRRIEIDDIAISSQRLRQLTDWRPRFSFEEGLAKTREIMRRSSRYGKSSHHRSAGAHRLPLHP